MVMQVSIRVLTNYKRLATVSSHFTVLYKYDQSNCLEHFSTNVRCTLHGYYFDTFETFEPHLFTILDVAPQVYNMIIKLEFFQLFVSDHVSFGLFRLWTN